VALRHGDVELVERSRSTSDAGDVTIFS